MLALEALVSIFIAVTAAARRHVRADFQPRGAARGFVRGALRPGLVLNVAAPAAARRAQRLVFVVPFRHDGQRRLGRGGDARVRAGELGAAARKRRERLLVLARLGRVRRERKGAPALAAIDDGLAVGRERELTRPLSALGGLRLRAVFQRILPRVVAFEKLGLLLPRRGVDP